MPPRLETESEKRTNKIRFLCKIPTLDITPSLQEEDCLICKEPYENNGWKLDSTMHRPVALPCRHVLGFQCLARWMLSKNFHNACPLCRAQIVSRREKRFAGVLEDSFINLEKMLIILVGKNHILPAQKRPLLDLLENSLRGERNALAGVMFDQIMVVWEEILNQFVAEPAVPTPVAQRPAWMNVGAPAVPARALERPAWMPLGAPVVPIQALERPAWWHEDDELRLLITAHIVFNFSFSSIAYIITGVLWDWATGRLGISTDRILLAPVCILACIASRSVAHWGVLPTWQVILWGVAIGALLASTIRQLVIILIL